MHTPQGQEFGSFPFTPQKLWTDVLDIEQEVMIKTISKKNKCKKAQWLSEEALQIVEKLKAKDKRKDTPI